MEKPGRFRDFCRYLQDPHLVASFQRVCGVRGTFSRSTSSSSSSSSSSSGGSRECDRPQALSNGACLRHLPAESDGESAAVVGAGEGETPRSTSQGLHERIKATGGSKKHGEDGEKLSQNGADLSGGESGSAAVKPLRKNSLTGDAGQEFIIQNRFLFYLFTFGTELGNELFYITFFPFVIWNIDAFVGRRIIMLWAWVMYLGQCTKDLLGWSRPASPPVVKVEVFYNSEYSMPSTHAMSGTAIPFALFYMTHGRWEYPFAVGFSVALSWCVLVCVSRIYMGMHSVLDVLVGVLYSSLILLVFLPLLDHIDGFIVSSSWSPALVLGLPFVLGLLSFQLDAWSTSRGDTAQILGTGAGVALASHVNRRLGFVRDPPPAALPVAAPSLSAWLFGVVLVRLVAGVAVLMATRAVMKVVTMATLCRARGLASDDDVRRARQHMEVELPYRYVVYGTVGFNVLFLVPLLFSYVQL